MRLLTVYARMDRVPSVSRALLTAGAPSVTITHVDGASYDDEPKSHTFAPGVEGKAPEVAKVEIVCATVEVGHLLRTLAQVAAAAGSGVRCTLARPVERPSASAPARALSCGADSRSAPSHLVPFK